MPDVMSCLLQVSALGPRAQVDVAHNLFCDALGAMAPDLVLPARSTSVGVLAADASKVTFYNYGDVPETVNFTALRFHSIQGQCCAPVGLWTGGRVEGSGLWRALNHVNYANSNVETSLLDQAGQGSLVIPAGLFAAGRTLRYECRGVLSCGALQTARFKLKVGGVDLIDNLGTLPSNLTNSYVEAQFDLFCHAGGIVDGAGRTLIQQSTGITTVAMRPLVGSDMVVDTTKAMAFDHTYQWTVADPGNSLAIHWAALRVLT